LTAVVIDTSLAVKWVLVEPYSQAAAALLKEWRDRDVRLTAPGLLAYEAANALFKRVRLGAMSAADAAIGLVGIMETVHDLDHDRLTHHRALILAQHLSRPTPYDAHYLALAEREGCECWTADERLWNAVKGALSYVRWIGEYQLKAV
jgi:predicted nucleic acid-binding protein